MAPKHHPTPLSGGDRKALNKELGKARAMTGILAAQSAEMRAKAETMLQQADRPLCESWNERMWSDGEPIDPAPTIDQAINDGFAGSRSGAPAARRRATSTWPAGSIRRPPSYTNSLLQLVTLGMTAFTGVKMPSDAHFLRVGIAHTARSIDDDAGFVVDQGFQTLERLAKGFISCPRGCEFATVGPGPIGARSPARNDGVLNHEAGRRHPRPQRLFQWRFRL